MGINIDQTLDYVGIPSRASIPRYVNGWQLIWLIENDRKQYNTIMHVVYSLVMEFLIRNSCDTKCYVWVAYMIFIIGKACGLTILTFFLQKCIQGN